ncbi:hypothetical protein [Flexivirga alba]|uniref:Uncharacterized protein n=1 Tax=Flexivirga alba TaxID=702742 RepID=A0ABW2AMC9_9MICO
MVGVAVEEDDRGVVEAEVLLAIREEDGAEAGVDDVVLEPCVLPPEEHPARTNPAAAQALTARTNGREAGTARR